MPVLEGKQLPWPGHPLLTVQSGPHTRHRPQTSRAALSVRAAEHAALWPPRPVVCVGVHSLREAARTRLRHSGNQGRLWLFRISYHLKI